MEFPLVGIDLCLRPWQENDAIAFQEAALESSRTVGQWMNWCHANYSLQEAHDWITACQRTLQEGSAYELGIFSGDGLVLYGGVGINLINRMHNYANIGYWVRENRQQQGIALDAVRLALEFGLQELQLQRLEIVVAETNLASRKLAEKVGGKFEGILRNRLLISGVTHPAAMYSVIPHEQHQ